MDRDYTIHEYENVRFINLSGKDINLKDGSVFEAERKKITAGKVRLRYLKVWRHNILPLNAPACYVDREDITFTESIRIPNPEDLEWVKSLPEDVLVFESNTEVCTMYGYPVCRYTIQQDAEGNKWHNVKSLLWTETP